MKVVIKEILPGSCSDSGIYDFWIKTELKNHQEILVFNKFYDLRGLEGKKADFIIFLKEALKDQNSMNIQGKFYSKYKFPQGIIKKIIIPDFLQESKPREKILEPLINGCPTIETENGIFLISHKSSFEEGSLITYYVDEYELYYWFPIE